MRALLTFGTGDVDQETILAGLRACGWVPTESPFIEQKKAELLKRLPSDVRAQLGELELTVIQVRPGAWGICSSENQAVLSVRLFSENPDDLKQVAKVVALEFPPALKHLGVEREVYFTAPIEIRKVENQERIFQGVVSNNTSSLRQWLARHRSRERKVLFFIISALVVCVASSVVLFEVSGSSSGEYVRGWLDRAASAFFVASLTTIVTLMFEYRDWRSRGVSIEWHVGSVPLAD